MNDLLEHRVPPLHPAHPVKLVGSKWTRVVEPAEQDPDTRNLEERCTHFVVTQHLVKAGEVELSSVLVSGHTVRVPWRALRDRARWRPGWS